MPVEGSGQCGCMRAPEMMFLETSRVERLGKLSLTPQSTGSCPVSPVLVSLSVCEGERNTKLSHSCLKTL